MRRFWIVFLLLVACSEQQAATVVPEAAEQQIEPTAISATATVWPTPRTDQPTSTAVVLPPSAPEALQPDEQAADLPILPRPVGDSFVNEIGQLNGSIALIQQADGTLLMVDPAQDIQADPVRDLIEQGYCSQNMTSEPSASWSADGRFLAIQCERVRNGFGIAMLDLASATWLSIESEQQIFAGGWQGQEFLIQIETSTAQYRYLLWNPTSSVWSAFPDGFPTNLAPQFNQDGRMVSGLRLEPDQTRLVIWDRDAATLQRFELEPQAKYTPAVWWLNRDSLLLVRLTESPTQSEGWYVRLNLTTGSSIAIAQVPQDTFSTAPLLLANPDATTYLMTTASGWQLWDGNNLQPLDLPDTIKVVWGADATTLIRLLNSGQLVETNLASSSDSTLASFSGATALSLNRDIDGSLAVGLGKPDVVIVSPTGTELKRYDGRMRGWRP